MAFKYKPSYGAKEVNDMANRRGGAFAALTKDGVQLFRPKEGDHSVRFLPPTWPKANHYTMDIFIHRNVGPDNEVFLCLDKMLKQPCPICEARRSGNDEEAAALKIGVQVAAYVIDRQNEKEGPMIWTMPPDKVAKAIAAISINKRRGEIYYIDDPNDGFDVDFKRIGTKMENTQYLAFALAREATPLADDPKVQDKWLEFVQDHPLPDVLNYFEADYLDKLINGKATGDEQEERDPPPRSSRGAARADEEEDPPPRQRTSRDRDDPKPEDEDPPFDHETGEVERPVRARSRPAQREEPEEEDQPAPRPRPRPQAAKPAEEEEETPARERLRRLSERGKK